MDRFNKGEVLGDGTFGVVFRGTEKTSGRVCAIKKIRIGKDKEGVNVTALREIKCLKEIRHPNIIELIDCFPHKRNLHLVFEYMESDLEIIIKDRSCNITPAAVKAYMQMTLNAVAYCHEHWILHRDLKPNNLLIAPNGSLKLADFGLARLFGSPDRRFTHQVFQRWYRAPELLFGCKHYDVGVDMWAVGCIFAELMLRRPYFPGSSDIDQLGKVFAALGTPSEKDWPGMRALPDFVEYNYAPAPDKRQLFTNATEDALHLLNCFLTYDPNKRISAAEALKHRYFRTSPSPCPIDQLPRPAPKQKAKPKEDSSSPNTIKQALAMHRPSYPPSAKMEAASGQGSMGPPPTNSEVRVGLPQASVLDETPSSTVQGKALLFQSTGTGVPTTGMRPGLDSDDRKFFRKRKLQLDQDLDAAFGSSDSDEDELPTRMEYAGAGAAGGGLFNQLEST